ncbi:MAG TPA: site-specific integrase [Rubrobacteraceae bacterium]|nr:site-specific integrase [Rubrobacteraceae bacterium]
MAKQRRANGEGGITKRKDGSYMARYTVQTAAGRKRKVLYAQSYEEARKKLAEALADRDRGLNYDAGSLTLEAYLERWLEDSVRGSVKVTTHASYGSVVRNHVSPALGRTKLAGLTPAHVQRLYRAKLDEGLSPKTVKYIHTTLHRALKQAVRWGLVPRNVAAEVDPPKVLKPEITPLSPAQARALLEAAKGNRLEALYVLAVTTGMRRGEILGLGWEAVELEAGTVRVRRTLTLAKGGPRLTEPKTKGSRRSIRLTASAVGALERHQECQQAEGIALNGSWADRGLVFCTRRGTPIRRDNLHDKSWKPLLKRSGLPDTRFHDLRHTCATLLLTKGVHPKIVSEMLGHSSIAITLDTYSHVIPGMGEVAVTAMEDALS